MHNILIFSLNTAEQSLLEVQPHVVTKLAEGRTKRLKTIEKMHKEARKDLEQRSLETCNVRIVNFHFYFLWYNISSIQLIFKVSTAHLEGFVVKAEKKNKESNEKSTEAVLRLRELLQIGTSQPQSQS